MTPKRLIFIAVTLLWLLLPTAAPAAVREADGVPCGATMESVGNDVERPQWRDIGMCDVLAVTGSSTLAPSPTVRVVHDSPSGTNVTAQTVSVRHNSPLRHFAREHRRNVIGYIYLIRCLRL